MFLTELHLHPHKSEWVLDAPLIYKPNRGSVITVPAGFETDLASIPRILRALYPKHGKQTRGAVVHDYLYDSQKLTRKQADNIFYEAMLKLDVRKTKALVMYYAVRLGGWIAWKNNKD